jgi:RHH-type rel operon transcriptional repressor/antitoxin RelB
MTTISVRIPDRLKKALDVIAKETERSKSFHVQKAIEFYLKEQADFQIALDRMNDTADAVLSSADMRKKRGL